MPKTVETTQVPKTYPVHEDQCWVDGDTTHFGWFILLGFIVGYILG
jgi:hypothetical protein